MNHLLLSELAVACKGRLTNGDVSVNYFCTDTRAVCEGKVFFALKGENFDAHSFVSQAVEKGAVALVVEQLQAVSIPQLIVPDTVKALGQLAVLWRSRFDIPVFGITGSNGKTTTKEMLAAILRQKGQVLATAGNFNNEIGLPLSLLKLHEKHKYVVLEHGASKAGDIAYLSEISQPTVALVTNAGHAHLASFGSLKDVARAKAEIYQNIKSNGVAVVNIDDANASIFLQASGHVKRVTYGFSTQADVQGQLSGNGQFTVLWQGESCTINLQLLGQHNRQNALAAIAAAISVGVSLDEARRGLESLVPVPGRLELKTNGRLTIIDDSYNANPDSFKAAIKTLVEQGDDTWCVMGDMAELGAGSSKAHHEIGLFARQQGVKKLLAIGSQSALSAEAFGSDSAVFESIDLLLDWINTHATSTTILLVKGSRSAQMERVVEGLLVTAGNNQKGGAV